MRTTSSAPVFQVPKRKRPSGRVWTAFFLCVLLPPVGLFVLWRGLRCPVRGKVLLSALALISMTVMLSLFISHQLNQGILIPQQAAGQYAVNDYTSSLGAVVEKTAEATAGPDETAEATAAPAQPEMTPAPANPFG